MRRQRTHVARLPARDLTEAMMRLKGRPTWAQLVEAPTQEKDKNETAHEGSGTTDCKIICVEAAPLSDQQHSECVRMSTTAVAVPTSISNRKPISSS